MKKLSWKNLYLTLLLVSLTACADLPKITPHVIDPQLEECREYEIVDAKQVIVKFKKSHPLIKCNGYWAISPQEAAALKSWYLKYQSPSNQ